jgi:catechol 2,3-dioxygenase-like lactoylglutathione lyase family enzyme
MALRMAFIFVRDLAAMTVFYRDVLGLEVRATSEGWVEFDGFGLHAVEGDWEVGPVREETPIKLVFDGDLARLESLGVRLLRRRWGGCDGVDPEGNVFGIISM